MENSIKLNWIELNYISIFRKPLFCPLTDLTWLGSLLNIKTVDLCCLKNKWDINQRTGEYLQHSLIPKARVVNKIKRVVNNEAATEFFNLSVGPWSLSIFAGTTSFLSIKRSITIYQFFVSPRESRLHLSQPQPRPSSVSCDDPVSI